MKRSVGEFFCLAVVFVSTKNVFAGGEITYLPLTSADAKAIQSACQGLMPAAEVKVTPSDIVVPENFKNYGDKIKHLKVRKNDIWIISYPKSGNTWTQEMVWLLTNNVDIKTASAEHLWERCVFLEYFGLWDEKKEKVKEDDPFYIIQSASEGKRRYIKTHMPVELLPDDIWDVKPKIIHVSRNPYDVAVSYFYHFQVWNNYAGSKELFFKAFLNDEVVLSPFWKHVLTYWKIRNTYGENNILFIKYEDMKKNLVKVMKKVAAFLNVRYPENKERELLEHLSFESMRNNKMDNFAEDIKDLHPNDYQKYNYMRKGIVGSWKEEEEFKPFIHQFEAWTKKNIQSLGGQDFTESPLE